MWSSACSRPPSASRGARRGAAKRAGACLPPDELSEREPSRPDPRLARTTMIEEIEVLREQARMAMARGDDATAVTTLLSAASKTHAADRDYDAVLRPLADVLTRTDDARRALAVVEALASNDPSAWSRAKPLLRAVPAGDRARALAAQGYMVEAAREAEDAGLVAAAAFLLETAGDWSAARTLWARLASRGDFAKAAATSVSGESMYIAALVQF